MRIRNKLIHSLFNSLASFKSSRPPPPPPPLSPPSLLKRRLSNDSRRLVGSGASCPRILCLTSLDVFFFFLLSAEACINSYAGALRGRSPDSMSGTGMSSIHPLFFLALINIYRTKDNLRKQRETATKKYTLTQLSHRVGHFRLAETAVSLSPHSPKLKPPIF